MINLRRSYHLDVVQHPIRTAEFGSASLSRLPLAPPIVVQLVIRDPAGHAINPYALSASLVILKLTI